MLINAGALACDAVDLLFRAASSAAAKKGQRIERYYRDCAMYRSHMLVPVPQPGLGARPPALRHADGDVRNLRSRLLHAARLAADSGGW